MDWLFFAFSWLPAPLDLLFGGAVAVALIVCAIALVGRILSALPFV